MAVYVICPHCLHPTVVPRGRTGKGRLCRQCGQVYVVDDSAALAAEAVPVRSQSDMTLLKRQTARMRLPVYRIV